jgi:hypothetical protein
MNETKTLVKHLRRELVREIGVLDERRPPVGTRMSYEADAQIEAGQNVRREIVSKLDVILAAE